MKRPSTIFRYYVILAVVYLGLSLSLPASKTALSNYHLTSGAYHALLFFVILPFVLIWFPAFYGYVKLQEYAQSIDTSAEGPEYSQLARGLQWLAWGLPAQALVSLILNAVANDHPAFQGAAIIITNYVAIVILLGAFNCISRASRGLSERTGSRLTAAGSKAVVLLFVVLGVVYCYLTFQHINLASLHSTDNPFYLPVWLLVLSVIVPLLYVWFLGLLAAYEVLLYGKHTRGLLYRQAIQLLSGGLVAVIASSIGVQYLRTISPRGGHLSLNNTLLLIYIIYIIMALGYISLSLGAKRLRKIEEV